MEYYFSDRKFNIMGVARTTGKGEWLVSVDSEVKATDDRPSIALTLTIPFKTEQEQAIDEMAAENNFVLYQDEEGNGHQMVIASVTHDTLAHIHTVVCTDAGNDLMNEVVGAYAADKAYTIADYILRFTNDSGWEIGINEFPTDVRTLTWTDEDTALSRIKSVAKHFDAVLSFGFVFVGTTAVKRVINIRHEETSDSLISFEMNKDINNIVKTVDIYDMETSVKAYGATPDGSNDPINLIGYSWTDPTGQFVLDQYGFLHDAIAVQKYSRLLSNNNPNPTQSDWNRVKTFDSTTQATLLQAALADLKKYNHPNVNYEVDLANAPYVPLNQTVHIVDENQNLFLSAKVLSVERSRAGHYTKLTLGDYANEQPNLYSALKDMAVKIENIPKTVQYYPWLRYADDDQGTNMSAFPTGKKYMAIVWSNKSSVPSDNPADYADKWALIKGADGANGKPGPKGADGTSSYLHTAYANSIDGKTDFSVTDASGRSYFGQYVDENQADSTDPTRYLWALFKGADGRDGKDGSDNVPVVTVGPSYPDKPKAGDQHWLTDEDGNVSAFAIFDNTNGWDTKPIAAAALNAETFNGMTFNGVTFNGSTFISSFKGFKPAGFANTVSGKTVIGDGTIVTDAKMDGNDKAAYHNETNQLGFISQYIYDGQVFSSFSAQGGSMVLSSTYAPHGTNVKLTSAFNASDAVYYQHIDSGLETNDVKNMRLGYSRQGPNVTIGIAFEMKTGNGWVRIADIRSGYKPFNNDDAARLLGSMSYTGAACQLYASAGGFYIIPWRGQGSYYGSVNFVTRDDYPIDDAVVI
ncbi:tail fiber protein and host specificity [Lactobacillus phage phiAT3]|uniref:Putative tail-host specificity protein n=3 Tax=root TaxID=1 RepID=Q6J1X1_9CAUD|nr:tail fiber protein and host specificity [Lactobacillus phage phiAT3]AAT36502.1 putative tail-host specificity protein [Lactobacillus phage phiAT3]